VIVHIHHDACPAESFSAFSDDSCRTAPCPRSNFLICRCTRCKFCIKYTKLPTGCGFVQPSEPT
jgi:hypothetical protein